MPFLDHLQELRVRIFIVIIWFMIMMCAGLYKSPQIVAWLIRPLTAGVKSDVTDRPTLVLKAGATGSLTATLLSPQGSVLPTTSILAESPHLALETGDGQRMPLDQGRAPTNLFFLSPLEPFMLLLKAAALFALVVTIPLAAYQAWLFVAPGLLRRERQIMKWVLTGAVALFPMGALVAYAISGTVMRVLVGFGEGIPGLEPSIVAAKGVGLILGLMLAFGLVFEFPMVLIVLARFGIVSAELLSKRRRPAIVIISVVAAVATPSPDPFSMVAMLIPMLGLYEGAIVAIRFMERASAAS